MTEEVSAPDILDSQEILELNGDRSRSILTIMKDGSRYLNSTPPLVTGLPLRCLQVISEALPLDVYLNFLDTASTIATKGSIDMNSIVQVLHHYFGIEKDEQLNSDPWSNFLNSTINHSNSSDPLLALLAESFESSLPLLKRSSYRISGILEEHLSSIIVALHLLAEDSKLSIDTQQDYQELSELILTLVGALGLEDWIDAYRRIVTSVSFLTPSTCIFSSDEESECVADIQLIRSESERKRRFLSNCTHQPYFYLTINSSWSRISDIKYTTLESHFIFSYNSI